MPEGTATKEGREDQLPTGNTDMATYAGAEPAPRWAHWAAHAAALTPLPSGLWRIGLACGFHLGFTAQGFRDMSLGRVWGPVYLVALSVLTEAVALRGRGTPAERLRVCRVRPDRGDRLGMPAPQHRHAGYGPTR